MHLLSAKFETAKKFGRVKTRRPFAIIKGIKLQFAYVEIAQNIVMLEINENSFHSSRKTRIFIEILCLVSRILMCRIHTGKV